MFEKMPPRALGTFAFNLSAYSWLGLNLQFEGWLPQIVAASYVQPNPFNCLCFVPLLYGTHLAILAIRKGSLVPAALVLMLSWSVITTIARHATGM